MVHREAMVWGTVGDVPQTWNLLTHSTYAETAATSAIVNIDQLQLPVHISVT